MRAIGGRVVDWLADGFLDLLADHMTPAAVTRGASHRARVLGRLEDWLMSKGGAHGAFSAGRYYARTSRFEAAEHAFRDAEGWYEQHLGANHPYVGYAAEKRAWCYVRLGEDGKALPLYEKALAVAEAGQGAEGDRPRDIREKLQLVRSRLQERA